METSNRRIEVSTEVRKKMARVFGVTAQTVSNALRFDPLRNTPLAKRIRAMAMEEGGVVMVTLPECETIHDEVNGTMVQTFGNGAKLVVDKHTGNATVFYKSVARMHQDDISVQQLYVLQEYAAGI